MKQTALEAEESRLQTSLEETRTILLGLQASNTSTEQKLEVAQTDLAKVRPEQNTSVFFLGADFFHIWIFKKWVMISSLSRYFWAESFSAELIMNLKTMIILHSKIELRN